MLACCTLAACSDRGTPDYVAQVINPDLTGGITTNSGALLAWGSDGTIFRSRDGDDWDHASTDTIVDIARIATSKAGTLIAVGAQGTLMRSTDDGRHWQTIEIPGGTGDLKAVVQHQPSRTWIAAGAHGRILRSMDDGQSWQVVESQLDIVLLALFVDPATQRVLIGGENGLVGYSDDAGTTWRLTWLEMPDPKTPITAFFRHDKLLLGISSLGRFVTSGDDAKSWDLLESPTGAIFTDSAFDPRHGAIVMTGHNGDVLRSTDNGRTWHTVGIEFDGHRTFLAAVRHDARRDQLIVVGQGGLVARSADGGATWTRASTDVKHGMQGLLLNEKNGQLVAYGVGGLLVGSRDGGRTWNHAQQSLEYFVRDVVPTPEGDALIAVGRLGAILRSQDGGRHWHELAVAYPNMNTPPDLRALLASTDGRSMVAAGPPGAVLRSSADGREWRLVHWTPMEEERALPWMLVDRSRRLLVAVEARGRAQVSRDAGVTWKPVELADTGKSFVFWQGAVLEKEGVMIVAGQGGQAVRSTNGAQSFTPIDTGTQKDLYGSFADAPSGLLFLLGQDGTLLRSTDHGASWRPVPSGSTQELRRMIRDPRSGALIGFGAHGTIVRSVDDGLSWTTVASGTDGVLREALIEPRSGNLLLVGGQGSLLRSTDGGRSWQALRTHTGRHFTSAVAVEPDGDIILAGERIVRLVRQ